MTSFFYYDISTISVGFVEYDALVVTSVLKPDSYVAETDMVAVPP